MSTGKISSKSEIIQDVGVTGKKFTGIADPKLLLGGTPVRYGFILLGKSFSKISEVILALPPQAITQDEPASTNITYTQNSGKFIERRGQISKSINLQGTTGYTPNPALPSLLRNNLPSSAIISQEAPSSGFSDFLRLRNLFRLYWRIFSDDGFVADRQDTLLLFLNEKDDECWVVEPMGFNMSRNSPGNKFTYNYSIALQTVAPFESIKFDEDTLTLFKKAQNVRKVVGQAANDITKTVVLIGNLESAAAGVIGDAIATVTAVATGIAGGLAAIADGTKELMELPQLIKGNIDNITGSFQGAWNQLLSVADSQAQSTVAGADPIPFAVHQALVTMGAQLAILSARSELFSQDFPSTWAKVLQNYDPNYGVGGYNQDLLAPLQRKGVQETTILPGDTLQVIAVRELGNAERAGELAVLNGLKPPYISPSGLERAPNTLAPGDPLLIPALTTGEASRVPVRTTVYTDPNFAGVVTSGSGSNVTVNPQGFPFRTNQWSGFTLLLPSLPVPGGPYAPPLGTAQTTQSDAIITGINLLSRNVRTCGDDLSNTTGFVQRALGGYDLAASMGDWFSLTTADAWEETHSIMGSPPGAGDVLSVFIPVISGATYTWSCYIKAPAGTVGYYIAMVDDLGGTSSSFSSDDLTNWFRVSLSFTVDVGSTMMQLQLAINTPTWYTDGWQLELASFATPWSDPGSVHLLPIQEADYSSFYPALVGDYLVLDPGGVNQDIVIFISAVAPNLLQISSPAHSHSTGTVVIDAGMSPTLPPNSNTTAGGPFSAIVVSNTEDTFTIDKVLPSTPTADSLVRISLQRPVDGPKPRKSSQEQLLGVDLALDGNDLQVTPTGTLALVDSTDNMQQAIEIKLKTEPGDLAAHPTFGLAFDPGQRVSGNQLFVYNVAVKQALLSDARIESLEHVEVSVDGDKLSLSAYVLLVGRSQPFAFRGAT